MNDNPFPANGPLDLYGHGDEPPRTNLPKTGSSTEPSLRRTVRINNPQGLHMRPAAKFAEEARNWTSAVIVWYRERSANGKSWLDLIMLAVEPFSEVILEVVGPDVEDAIPKLADLLGSDGSDDVPING